MKDFYKYVTKKLIKEYCEAIYLNPGLKDRIKELEDRKGSCAIAWGAEPVKGGGTSYETKLLNINAEIDLLKSNVKDNEDIIKRVDTCLNDFSNKYKNILLVVYGSNDRGRVDVLINRYHYSKTQIYAIANNCLNDISKKLFGKC